ncbi:hypothetical protein F5Y15DRAFT_378587 [Xylariaceae sp. FL0016]|nr:hypothetical protein F5Y15DRAFT_378587 [Xylariaceae sp. FL0016]
MAVLVFAIRLQSTQSLPPADSRGPLRNHMGQLNSTTLAQLGMQAASEQRDWTWALSSMVVAPETRLCEGHPGASRYRGRDPVESDAAVPPSIRTAPWTSDRKASNPSSG